MKNILDDDLLLKSIFESSVDGIIIINRSGIIESINPAACKQFGYLSNEVIGKNISMLMPSPDREKHDTYLSKYHESGKKNIIGIGREVEGLRKDGTTFPFKLSVSEIIYQDSSIYTGFIHDISDQKQAENKLLELTKELEQKVRERTEDLAKAIEDVQAVNTNLKQEVRRRKQAEEDAQKALLKELELGELKSRFVSMASHEFRTPLTGILSSISLIAKYNTQEQEEKKLKHVNRIRTSVQSLTNILNDFLSLDKLQAGKIECNPGLFNLQWFLDDLMEELEQVKKANQELILELNGDYKGDFYSDRNILKNILLNLLSNAIKYSEEGKKIYLKVDVNKEEIKADIIDQGIGIPELEQEKLFERFFRAKNALNIQGTGLGLNIVKSYVELLGGSIRFVSEENIGSTFSIKIPKFES